MNEYSGILKIEYQTASEADFRILAASFDKVLCKDYTEWMPLHIVQNGGYKCEMVTDRATGQVMYNTEVTILVPDEVPDFFLHQPLVFRLLFVDGSERIIGQSFRPHPALKIERVSPESPADRTASQITITWRSSCRYYVPFKQ